MGVQPRTLSISVSSRDPNSGSVACTARTLWSYLPCPRQRAFKEICSGSFTVIILGVKLWFPLRLNI